MLPAVFGVDITCKSAWPETNAALGARARSCKALASTLSKVAVWLNDDTVHLMKLKYCDTLELYR
jgi:hypothetical protein